MSDGSVLQLTSALGVDRAGRAHETVLVFDVTVTDTLGHAGVPPARPSRGSQRGSQ
jgi:hypothetical protein